MYRSEWRLAGPRAASADASGYVGPWTGTPTVFSNMYYKLLLKGEKDGVAFWTPDERQKNFQYKARAQRAFIMTRSRMIVSGRS